MVELIIEFLFVLFVYFGLNLVMLRFLTKRTNLTHIFIRSISTVNLFTLGILFVRIIFLLNPILPFFEYYIIKAFLAPIYYFFPDWINSLSEKSEQSIPVIIVQLFSTLLVIYHLVVQFLMLRIPIIKSYLILIVSSILPYSFVMAGIFVIHKLLLVVKLC